MQTSNKNNNQPHNKQNRQTMTIASVAFTALAFFFLIFLFKGPGTSPEPAPSHTQMPVPAVAPNPVRPAQQPVPKIDLQVTEQNPNAAGADNQQTSQPDANTATQDGNSLTVPLEPDSTTTKPNPEPAQAPSTTEPARPATRPAPKPPKQPKQPKASIENPARQASAPRSGSYTVQAGAYADKSHADRLAAELKSKGYKVESQSSLAESLTLYRVQVGGFRTRDDAQELADGLSEEGYSPSVIRVDQPPKQ